MPLIKRGSNFVIFAALYCSCLGFNALLSIPTKEGGNKGIKCREWIDTGNKCSSEYMLRNVIKVQYIFTIIS